MTMPNEALRRTPIYEEHLKQGGRMVPFAGWEMPVEYEGLRQEHNHVRQAVGLFDVSHMGEIRVTGDQALAFLQSITSNDLAAIGIGQAQYSLLTNEQGGVVDDLIIYCLEKDRDYLLCVNAANTEKDWQWVSRHSKNWNVNLTNESEQWGQIAIQGPKGVALTAKVLGDAVKDIKPFHFRWVEFQGAKLIVARTGYTGEDGFEVFVPESTAAVLWRELMTKGSEFTPRPIGLGARDTLRTEMKYSLYGHEIDDTTDPLSAGLGWVVKLDRKDFIGKDVIQKVKQVGVKSKLVGFKLVDKGIPRQGYKVLSVDKREIGKVTSGTLSPTLGEAIGIAYVLAEYATAGQEIAVDVRGRPAKAIVVPTPFVKTRGD